jgi:bifunctional UDP-N-acetylglucosamine pyrophosphorylase/glucosamine-1-phosphate N-acetyltransferase
MASRTCLTIVLAAGEGTRMRSARAKVLHEAAGRSLLGHVLAAAMAAGAEQLAVVVGPGRDDVAGEARRHAPGVAVFGQAERRGTADAVLAARAAIATGVDDVLVLFGDTPLVTPQTLARMRGALADGAAVAVAGFHTDQPGGYGRLLVENGELIAVREDKDATAAERDITFCNGGLTALGGADALALLGAVGNDNAQHEFYLPDVVAIARARGFKAVALEAPWAELQGVNDRVQLAAVEQVLQDRLRRVAMAAGATLIAPDTVYLSADTALGTDVVVEPHVVFGPGVTVAAGTRIRAFSHLEGAMVAHDAVVGPFSRLRPGADIGAGAHIGNFVEIKNATVGVGAKINHLTYVGDARIGPAANLGAGTITCNYDGYAKHLTEIGAGAFIGSNSALVAPVKIGDGAYVGSGSVVTADVPSDALALGRSRQMVKAGWAARWRAAHAKQKQSG